jgi:hypothetical protein
LLQRNKSRIGIREISEHLTAFVNAVRARPGVTVHEQDDSVVHFARPFDQEAVSRAIDGLQSRETLTQINDP